MKVKASMSAGVGAGKRTKVSVALEVADLRGQHEEAESRFEVLMRDLAADRRARLTFCFAVVAAHEERLATRVLKFLDSKRTVRVIGSADPDRTRWVPTISFVVEGRPSDAIAAGVDPHRIDIRYGDLHARRLSDDFGLAPQNGGVCGSMVHYNTLAGVVRCSQSSTSCCDQAALARGGAALAPPTPRRYIVRMRPPSLAR